MTEGLLDSSGWRCLYRCGQPLDVEQSVIESGASNRAYNVGRIADQGRGLTGQLPRQILRDRGTDEIATIESPVDGMTPR